MLLEQQLSQKDVGIASLEQTLLERQDMLQHSDVRISELEEVQVTLQGQVGRDYYGYWKIIQNKGSIS